eukprot:2137854-Lingulodinium_polyedra.AAC.1
MERPPHWQQSAWSPKRSIGLPHRAPLRSVSGQAASSPSKGRAMRHFMASTQCSSKKGPRKGAASGRGRAKSHRPATGPVAELRMARLRRSRPARTCLASSSSSMRRRPWATSSGLRCPAKSLPTSARCPPSSCTGSTRPSGKTTAPMLSNAARQASQSATSASTPGHAHLAVGAMIASPGDR